MKAAIVKDKKRLEVADMAPPEPKAGEVVVEVAYCGICGSDIHMLEAGLFPNGSVPGHELSGRIASIGAGVSGFSQNDRVVVLPGNPCFQCVSCRNGLVNLCTGGLKRTYGLGYQNGGFAEYICVDANSLFKVPDNVDLKVAALTEPLAVALHGVNFIAPRIGDVGIVFGAGPIGLLTIYILKMSGIAKVAVCEPDELRAQRALRAGANIALDPKDNDTYFKVIAALGRQADFAADCAGTPSSMMAATNFVGPRGKVLVLGVCMTPAQIIPASCISRETQIFFSYAYSLKEFGDAVQLLAADAVDSDLVVSDTFPLKDIQAAFDVLKTPGHSKILIDCKRV